MDIAGNRAAVPGRRGSAAIRIRRVHPRMVSSASSSQQWRSERHGADLNAENGMLQSKRRTRRKPPVRAGGKQTTGHALHAVDYEALARFRFQLRKFLSFSEATAHGVGLTPQQHQALLAIKGFSGTKPISVGDLAEFLLVRHHTAVELVDRITRLGWLRRIADDGDSRRTCLKLTKKGEQKLRTLSKIHFEELQSAGPGLSRILRSFRLSQAR
jgi:DNA-binding MarR family transcriptional regulator